MAHNCQGDGAEGVEQSNQPALCTNGCGFFANPTCNNMCSKCYRDSEMTAERSATNAKAASAALSDVQALADIKEVGLEAAPARRQPRAPPPQAPATPSEPARRSIEAAAPKLEAPSASAEAAPSQRAVQKNAGRCFVCNKKVGLTGFKCRCEYVFCGAHRLAEAHNCSVDYKLIGRQRLAENNPLVQAAKIHKV